MRVIVKRGLRPCGSPSLWWLGNQPWILRWRRDLRARTSVQRCSLCRLHHSPRVTARMGLDGCKRCGSRGRRTMVLSETRRRRWRGRPDAWSGSAGGPRVQIELRPNRPSVPGQTRLPPAPTSRSWRLARAECRPSRSPGSRAIAPRASGTSHHTALLVSTSVRESPLTSARASRAPVPAACPA